MQHSRLSSKCMVGELGGAGWWATQRGPSEVPWSHHVFPEVDEGRLEGTGRMDTWSGTDWIPRWPSPETSGGELC